MSVISWSERNEIVHKWPLMSSPVPLLTVFAVYIWFVFKAGPKYMENRKPFNLSLVTRLYNVYQMLTCAYFVYEAYGFGFAFSNAWKCTHGAQYEGKITPLLMRLYKLCWYFILLRLSEFLETVFFILRKKSDQVSLLHVYHHISTVVILWIFLLYSGGQMELYLAAFNSAVHVIMYGYYFLSSFKQFRKFTNIIKPFITFIQVFQLFILFGHCAVALKPSCNNTRLFVLQLLNVGFLISMFLKFSFDTFIKKKNVTKIE